ncbi:COP9 signalosome complex subunit 8-like [Musca vetustissima]|uniref:COP9 signalosome complex subunit 8-like n=1 Tax=Musca vetustissima TaxID=27455 RepID=UPI002AB76330|nr:COP9 signalosome complex subunit 8-like [Musca vetustissima]
MENYVDVVLDIEQQELEVPVLSSALYTKLFACYLLQNRLNDAKFLWKRLPQKLCAENEDLKELYIILRSLLSNNIQQLIQRIGRDWPDDIKPIMESLLRTTHGNIPKTVENAYASIVKENLIEAVEAYQKYVNETSTNDSSTPLHGSQNATTIVSSEHQLSKLTGFVSFLEN